MKISNILENCLLNIVDGSVNTGNIFPFTYLLFSIILIGMFGFWIGAFVSVIGFVICLYLIGKKINEDWFMSNLFVDPKLSAQ